MTKRDWAVLACKTLALWILYHGLGQLAVFLSGVYDTYVNSAGDSGLLWSSGPAVVMSFAVILWVGAPWFATRMFPEDGPGDVAPGNGEALLSVAVLFMGSLIFLHGAFGILEAAVTALATRRFYGQWDWPGWHGKLWSSVARIIVGLWLILGNRGVVCLLQRCRTFGWRAKAEAAAEQAEQIEQGE